MSGAKQSSARAKLVVCLDGDIMTAAELSGRGDEPKRWVSEPLGKTVRRTDARAVGQRLGELLEQGGLSRGKAIYAATRSDVVLKHLAIPKAASMRDDHLDQSIKLQVRRQLNMPADEALLDYTLVPGEADDRPVLAVAIPRDRVVWLREMCAAAAGIELVGIGLRPAALAARVQTPGTTMLVWVGPSSVEYVVCHGGKLVFARGVDLGATSAEDLPERVRVEAGRTMMSYRVQSGLPAVEGFHLAGRRCGGLADRFAADHALPVTEDWSGSTGSDVDPEWGSGAGGESHKDTRTDAHIREGVHAAVWSLGAIRRAMEIDFLSPTAPRDHASRRRQMVLAAIGLLLVGGMGLYLLADQQIRDLEADRAALDESVVDLRGRYAAYLLDAARLQHIRAWDDQNAAWTDHINELVEMMPDRDHGRLNSLTARGISAVRFDPTGSLDSPGAWTGVGTVTLAFDASIPDRNQATAFRARLIEGGVYEVSTKGADEPGRVSWSIVTRTLKFPEVLNETGTAARTETRTQTNGLVRSTGGEGAS